MTRRLNNTVTETRRREAKGKCLTLEVFQKVVTLGKAFVDQSAPMETMKICRRSLARNHINVKAAIKLDFSYFFYLF